MRKCCKFCHAILIWWIKRRGAERVVMRSGAVGWMRGNLILFE